MVDTNRESRAEFEVFDGTIRYNLTYGLAKKEEEHHGR